MARPKAKQGVLGMFEGGPVDDVAVKITRAGDGLSEALKVQPVKHESGEVCYFVLKTMVGSVSNNPKVMGMPEAGFTRVENHVAQEITEVAEEDVETMLKDAADRILQAKEDAAGVTPLIPREEAGASE